MKQATELYLLAQASKAVLDLDPTIGEIAAVPEDLARVTAHMASWAADAVAHQTGVPVLRHRGR